jgi:hypothetical protein
LPGTGVEFKIIAAAAMIGDNENLISASNAGTGLRTAS